MTRLAILGAPRSGKTTLARTLAASLSVPVRSTDDAMKAGWSEASEIVSHWFDAPGGQIVEGVAVARALRKWLARNPTGRPCDELVVLTGTVTATTKGQDAMGKGVATVLAEIESELVARGVVITRGRAPAVAA